MEREILPKYKYLGESKAKSRSERQVEEPKTAPGQEKVQDLSFLKRSKAVIISCWSLLTNNVRRENKPVLSLLAHGQTVMSVCRSLSRDEPTPTTSVLTVKKQNKTNDGGCELLVPTHTCSEMALCRWSLSAVQAFSQHHSPHATWMLPETCFLVSLVKGKHGFVSRLKRDCVVHLTWLCVCENAGIYIYMCVCVSMKGFI